MTRYALPVNTLETFRLAFKLNFRYMVAVFIVRKNVFISNFFFFRKIKTEIIISRRLN